MAILSYSVEGQRQALPAGFTRGSECVVMPQVREEGYGPLPTLPPQFRFSRTSSFLRPSCPCQYWSQSS
ncbi:hypothetical protein ACCAA_220046 [Candidatus Accumulibacter aalborgensis]|uniref:Uncharacterized protein n=1 Tax=Candidatus Accumulibacter aalborgensis TaxID=1860102 RepID=A0A1A8XK42_9PROT|nr:hypothetical protein ACCAA_220046 [Candidatus Accumulibacter aalborgensis]